jgi:RecA/RadA recombinase
VKAAVVSQAPELEQLTKIVTEVETLKDIQGKAEQTFKEDLMVVDSLAASIQENEQILKKNLASLKARVESLSK